MPFNSTTKRYDRPWQFVDRYAAGEHAPRTGFDLALNDSAAGVNDAIQYLEGVTDALDLKIDDAETAFMSARIPVFATSAALGAAAVPQDVIVVDGVMHKAMVGGFLSDLNGKTFGDPLRSSPQAISFPSLALLNANSSLTYTAGLANTVEAGDFIVVHQEGLWFTVAPSSSTTHVTATAGGIKLYLTSEPTTFFPTESALLGAPSAVRTANLAGEIVTRDTSREWISGVPGWKYADQKIGEARFAGRGRASVTHKTTASYGGIFYDVISVTGGPHTVKKKFGPDADSLGVQLRRTARNMSEATGFPIVINADRASAPNDDFWTTSLSGINRGLQIVDGVAYRDFQAGTSQDEAFVMMHDGTHRVARIADGKTAAQWVADGAVWTVGGFAFLVIGGVAQDVSADASISDISARTIFGRMPNGDFKIIIVEGETGVYGIGGQNMVSLCASEGMDIAIVLDGGGSSQCWWGGAYAHPSSDTSDTVSANPLDAGRRVCGFLCVDVDSVTEYNSGILPLTTPADLLPFDTDYPSLYLRQIGGNIFLNANIAPTAALPANADKLLTSVAMRKRHFSTGANALRGNLQAFSGGGYAWAVPVIASGEGILTLRPGTIAIPGPATASGVHGSYSWRARWAR